MSKKYEFVEDDKIKVGGATLTRIRAIRPNALHKVNVGDLGGYIQYEGNLSHYGDCWVHQDARMEGCSTARDGVLIGAGAHIRGNAALSGFGFVENVVISDRARLTGLPGVRDQSEVGWGEFGDHETFETVTWFRSILGGAFVFFHTPLMNTVRCVEVELAFEEARKIGKKPPTSINGVTPVEAEADLRAIASFVQLRAASWRKECCQ